MRLSFYKINQVYYDFIKQYDNKVPHISGVKENRPFVGTVLYINGFSYYAPLSSPKEKHLLMKNNLDFLKIDNGKLGVINFNNMLPVPKEYLIKIDTVININDDMETVLYKNLLINQLTWCNSNKEVIFNKAQKLYNLFCENRLPVSIKNRCCDFITLELKCKEYLR